MSTRPLINIGVLMALLGVLAYGCLGDHCPCTYVAHFGNASAEPAYVQFRTPYDIGDEPNPHPARTVFVVPPGAGHVVSPSVGFDLDDRPGFDEILLLGDDCGVLARLAVDIGDEPTVVIQADGKTMAPRTVPLLGPGIQLMPSPIECPSP